MNRGGGTMTKTRKSVKILAAIISTILLICAGAAATAENPAVPENATVLACGDSAEAVIADAGGRAAFSFAPEETATYCFYSTGSNDTKARLYDAGMTLIAENDDGGEGSNFLIECELEAGQQYYYEAYYYSNSNTGTISVHLSNRATIEGQVTDAATGTPLWNVKVSFDGKETTTNSEGEFFMQSYTGTTGTLAFSKTGYISQETENFTASAGINRVDTTLNMTATVPLTLDTVTDAEILTEGGRVFFKYTAEQTKFYRFTSSASADTYGELYDDQMNMIMSNDDGGENSNFQVAYELEAGRTYYYAARYYGASSTGTIPVTLTYDRKGILRGTVTDSRTGDPLANVLVTFGEDSAYTDYSGNYYMEAFIGTHNMVFQLHGYNDKTLKSVKLTEDQSLTKDAQMVKYIPTSATKITKNTTKKATFTSGGEEVFFKFTPTADGTYHIYTICEDSLNVQIYDDLMDELGFEFTSDNWQEHIYRQMEEGKTYYIKLTGNNQGYAYVTVTTGERALLAGHVTDAGGSGGISGATLTYGSSTTTTNEEGFYYFLLSSPKTATLKAENTGFISANFEGVQTEKNRTTRQEIVLSEVLDDHEYRVVLTWGSTPADLDSHLEGPGYHVYFHQMSGKNAVLDVDDTTSYGPETITFRTEDDKTYTYYVHDYTNRGSTGSTALQGSGATVTIYNGGNHLATLHVPTGSAGIYWNVFTIRNGQISYTNRISRKSPNDTAKTRLVDQNQYAITVVDSKGLPIEGANVTFGSETQTTDADGDVFFDALTFDTPVITVVKDGYQPWTNTNSAWEKSPTRYETIILYTEAEGEMKLKSCLYRNIDGVGFGTELTTSTKKLSLGNDVPLLGDMDFGNFYLTCEAINKSKVSKYQIWQGAKQKGESTDGHFALNSENFEKGGNCFIRVLGKNGEQVDTKINLLFTKEEINEKTTFKLTGKKFSFEIGDDVPFFGGSTFNLDLPLQIPLTYEITEDKIQIGFNVNVAGGDDEKEQIKKTKQFIDDLKTLKGMKKVGKLNKKQRDTFNSLIKSKNKTKFFQDAELNFLGYAEADLGSSTATGCLILEFSIKAFDFEFNTWCVVVPVTVQVEISLEASARGEISYNWDTMTLDGSLSVTPAAEVKAFGGVGVSCLAGIGAYGSARLETELEIIPRIGFNYVDLTGELGLKAYLGFLTYERPFAYNTWHLYTRNSRGGEDGDGEDLPETEQELYALLREGLYDASNYKPADLSYLSREKNHLGQGGDENLMGRDTGDDLRTSFKALIEGTYRNAQPVMITANDAIYAAFLHADADSGRVYTVVSKYDGTSWSAETAAAAGNTLDNMPALLADNAGRIWLAFARTGSGYDGTSLLSYAQNQEIVVGLINPDTLAFTRKKVYTGTGYAHMHKLSLVNGKPTLVWVDSEVSTDNDVLWPQNNTVRRATCSGTTWGSATTVNTVQNVITELAVGEENEALTVGVIADQDNLSGTAADKALILLKNGEAQTVAEGAGSINYGTLPGTDTPAFLWLQNGILYNAEGEVLNLQNVAGEFRIAGNSIYYSVPTETGAELCVSKYENGSWTLPIVLTSGEGYLDNVSVAQLNGKDYVMGMYATVTITDTEVDDAKDLIWTSVSAVSDLNIDSVTFDADALTPGEEFPITIDVENRGDHAVTSVELDINGSSLPAQAVTINAGETAAIQATLTCPEYLETYTVTVNETNWTDYRPEDNSYEFKAGYGDLSVQLQSRQIGDKTTVIAVVRNEGINPTDGRLFLNSMQGELLFERPFDALSNGQTYIMTYEFDWSEREDNQFDIKATAESNTDELHSFNNTDTIHLTYNGQRKMNPEFILPGQLQTIEEEAFAGIRARTVQLQEGITTIGPRAFMNCGKLEQIEIPATVTRIAEDAFEGTDGFVIYCPAGSGAESFAEAHHIICITE